MISDVLKGQIRRLYMIEGWRPATIARQLGIHRATVRKVLQGGPKLPHAINRRHRMIDDYVEVLKTTLKNYPDVSSSILFRLVRRSGYRGISSGHFRRIVAEHRPRKQKKVFLTIETPPAEEAQVDWAHFGSIDVGKGKRSVVAFVFTLCYSRKIFVRFFHSMTSAFFLQGFVEAFRAIGGVPRRIIIDNCKTGVVEHIDGLVRFHPDFLALASHYNFEPIAARVRTPTDKGKVERTVRYIRSNLGIELQGKGLDEINETALEWCRDEALARPCPGYQEVTVETAFEHEKSLFIALPEDEFACMERVEYVASKQMNIRFDRNLYSVPSSVVGCPVTLFATETEVFIQHQGKEVARHRRSWDSGVRVEDPAHFAALREQRKQAQKGSVLATLNSVFPSMPRFAEGVVSSGVNLGSVVAYISKLRLSVGDKILGEAIARAAEHQRYHLSDLRREIDIIQLETKEPPPPPESLSVPPAAMVPPLKPINWKRYNFNNEVLNEL